MAAADSIEAGASDREVAKRFRVTQDVGEPVAAGTGRWWPGGVVVDWGKAFADLYRQPPDWYQPARPMDFSTWMLVNDLDRSMWMMNQTFPTQPRDADRHGQRPGRRLRLVKRRVRRRRLQRRRVRRRRGKLVVRNTTWRYDLESINDTGLRTPIIAEA